MKATSSSPLGPGGGTTGATTPLGGVAGLAAVTATGGSAPPTTASPDGMLATTGAAGGACATALGEMRSTWPTSIRSGLSRLFRRTMSRQLTPLSLPILRIVSPGLTV